MRAAAWLHEKSAFCYIVVFSGITIVIRYNLKRGVVMSVIETFQQMAETVIEMNESSHNASDYLSYYDGVKEASENAGEVFDKLYTNLSKKAEECDNTLQKFAILEKIVNLQTAYKEYLCAVDSFMDNTLEAMSEL